MAKMEELLDKCSRLPSWCKQRIQLEYEMAINRKNGKAIESFINLDGEWVAVSATVALLLFLLFLWCCFKFNDEMNNEI